MILVKLADLLEIVLQLRFIQPARFIDERKKRFLSRFHLLAQHPVGKMCVALKAHRADRAFYPFINRVNRAGSAADGINRFDAKRHLDIVETVRLISFHDLFPALLQIFFSQRGV